MDFCDDTQAFTFIKHLPKYELRDKMQKFLEMVRSKEL